MELSLNNPKNAAKMTQTQKEASNLLLTFNEKLLTYTNQTAWADVKMPTSDDVDVFYSKWNLAKKSEYFTAMFNFNDKKGDDKREICVLEETKNYSLNTVSLLLFMLDDESYTKLFSLPEFTNEHFEVIKLITFFQMFDVLNKILGFIEDTELPFEVINKFCTGDLLYGANYKRFERVIKRCVDKTCHFMGCMSLKMGDYGFNQVFFHNVGCVTNLDPMIYNEIILCLMFSQYNHYRAENFTR